MDIVKINYGKGSDDMSGDDSLQMIRKNLKTTSAKFEEEDKMERGRATKVCISCSFYCFFLQLSFFFFML